jgi:methionyl-tRNA formyltransferase
MSNRVPTFAFLGCTNFSKTLLLYLIEQNFIPAAIFTIPKKFNISYSENKVINSNFADLQAIAKENSIPIFEVESKAGMRLEDYQEVISEIGVELMLVLGWYYMIPRSVREPLTYGAWGIHASLLPKYAGGAPLGWAIIKGETETGVTLFRMDDGVDDGDIIAQRSFEIDFNDTIKDVYFKAEVSSKLILSDVLSDIRAVKFTPQDKSEIEVYPQRRPDDGELDLSQSAEDLYNFIRAQSSPYPGAFIRTVDGKKLIIEESRIE